MSTDIYYPPGVEIANYITNDYDTLTLVSIFASASLAQLAVTYLLVTQMRPQISTKDLSIALWFSLCGSIHLILEGYYTLNFHHMGPQTSLLAQLWKEYAFSDSRYLSPNSFVWPMETITAFLWGPLSFTLVYLIAADHPLRYPIQVVVSLGQLYGDVLYYGTCFFEKMMFGVDYARPEPGYFWGYFVFLNLFWIVIPFGCVVNGIRAFGTAFGIVKQLEREGNNTAKKTL